MIKYTNSELCLIWLDSIIDLDYKRKRELYNLINGKEGIKEFLESNEEQIVATVGKGHYKSLVESANKTYLSYVTENLSKQGITAVTLQSKSYPEKLRQTPFAPLTLYAKGDIGLLSSDCFAVVGSRKSLPISIALAEEFSQSLSKAGFTLVTGIAEGVDQTVIRTALKNSKRVISVLGGGFDNVYPSSNAGLVEEVVEKGLVITEYPPEIKAMSYHFPVRNRIIAGLSKGALIVSGGLKSGTQYTASYAVEYSRDLFVIPYSVGIKSGAGCNDLIKKGGILCDCPNDILDYYGIEQKEQTRLKLDKAQLEIVNALSEGEMHIQKICQSLNKQIFEILPIISVLEIMGVVSKNGVNVYGLTQNVLEE